MSDHDCFSDGADSYPEALTTPAKLRTSSSRRLAALLMLALGTSVSYACGTFAYLQVLSLPVAVFCTVVVAAPCVLVGEALVDPWTATHRGGPSRWIARGISR